MSSFIQFSLRFMGEKTKSQRDYARKAIKPKMADSAIDQEQRYEWT